jgi:hypothetical protein
MKQIIDSIRQALRADPKIQAMVGLDDDYEVKAYEGIAKSNVDAPYVAWSVIPGVDSPPVYGDSYVIQDVMLRASSWGRNSKEAWQLAEFVQEAFELADYATDPWHKMFIRRSAFPQELPDRDTNLVQVSTDYWLRFSR